MGGGAGLLHPVGLLSFGPAVLRQGSRRLKDITPEELSELLAWTEIDPEDVITVEEMQQERDKPVASLHPHYCFEYVEGEPAVARPDIIFFSYWSCDNADDYAEWSEVDGCIQIGDVRTYGGCSIASPGELVKWFLNHGFKVW